MESQSQVAVGLATHDEQLRSIARAMEGLLKALSMKQSLKKRAAQRRLAPGCFSNREWVTPNHAAKFLAFRLIEKAFYRIK
jgi:hypothetical protein